MAEDIWSSVGNDITKDEGEWLYKVGVEMRGPMPHRQLVEKLLNGEIDFDTLVAREGTDFYPLKTVNAFLPHLEAASKARKQREAAKRRKQIAMFAVPLVVIAAVVVGYLQMQHKAKLAKDDKERAALAAKLAAQPAPDANLPKLGLVALVSLGEAKDVKIASQNAPAPEGGAAPSKRKGKGKKQHIEQGPDGPEEAGGAAEDMVQTCALTQNDIFGTLRNALGKLNVCVDDEKKRDTQNLLPPVLELAFIVKPNGKVTEFEINDRHYRAGPLNNCLIRAFGTIVFPESNGANCPVTIPIKIGK